VGKKSVRNKSSGENDEDASGFFFYEVIENDAGSNTADIPYGQETAAEIQSGDFESDSNFQNEAGLEVCSEIAEMQEMIADIAVDVFTDAAETSELQNAAEAVEVGDVAESDETKENEKLVVHRVIFLEVLSPGICFTLPETIECVDITEFANAMILDQLKDEIEPLDIVLTLSESQIAPPNLLVTYGSGLCERVNGEVKGCTINPEMGMSVFDPMVVLDEKAGAICNFSPYIIPPCIVGSTVPITTSFISNILVNVSSAYLTGKFLSMVELFGEGN